MSDALSVVFNKGRISSLIISFGGIALCVEH